LSCNYIETVKADFFEGCNNLSILILKECKIKKIDIGAFRSLKNLETIDVSINDLAYIPPKLFIKNPSIKNVSLSRSPLNMLHDGPILVSSSLLHLHMANCMISELSSTSLSQLPNLQSLDLSNSGLKVLPADNLIPLVHLNNIKLGGNVWTCNDNFEKLVRLAYHKSNSQPCNLTCATKNGWRKDYNLRVQYEFCGELSATKSSVTSITSTPKELVDVATVMTFRTLVTLFQNTSQEYTIAGFQEDVHKRTTDSDKAFTPIMSKDLPRPNDNKGKENSEQDASQTQNTLYSKWVTETQVTSEAELRSPKELVDVATDMTLRTSVTLFQNTSQEYTTAVLQESIHKRTNESNKAFTPSMSTDPPRPNDNKGPENSEEDASETQMTPYSQGVTETQRVRLNSELHQKAKREAGGTSTY
jgi:hypothetical protein